MPTVTIRLDEETDIRLKRHLARKGETLSSFIRAAVVQELDAAPRAEPRAASLARVTNTGETDLSTTCKARLQEALLARHRR